MKIYIIYPSDLKENLNEKIHLHWKKECEIKQKIKYFNFQIILFLHPTFLFKI